MGYPGQKGSLVIYSILVPFIVLFIHGFYKSVSRVEMPNPVLTSQLDSQDVLEEHQPGFFDAEIIKKSVNLEKGRRTIIDKTAMVFKGISQDKVLLDLYLLEMDPDVSYPLDFSKESMRQGIWLDNIKYKLVSLSKNTLGLQIMDAY